MALMDRDRSACVDRATLEAPPAPVGLVLMDCMQAMSNLEGVLYQIEAKLVGVRPTDPTCLGKATSEPPIDSRCRELAARLCAAVKFAESLSDKL